MCCTVDLILLIWSHYFNLNVDEMVSIVFQMCSVSCDRWQLIYIYIYTCVCVCASMYVCVCMYVYVCMCVWMYECMCICMNVCTLQCALNVTVGSSLSCQSSLDSFFSHKHSNGPIFLEPIQRLQMLQLQYHRWNHHFQKLIIFYYYPQKLSLLFKENAKIVLMLLRQ